MSLQQIVREFPFLKSHTTDEDHTHSIFWQNAIVQAMVSRLSLEALELTMEKIPPRENFSVDRQLEILDEKGNAVFHREFGQMDFTTIGDALLYIFPNHDKEWTEEVHYVLYITDYETAKIRHGLGKKAHRVYKTERREMILFKMPKGTTLWQLLQRYRQQKSEMRQ